LQALFSPEKRRQVRTFSPGIPNRFLSGKRASGNLPFFSLMKGGLTMDLEDVFCSKTRMKLLKILFDLRQLNTSDLARKLGTNYDTTRRHLALLEEEGLIQQRLSGKTRFFRYTNTVKANAVMRLLDEWDQE
jgi:DNA-binding transcriptional ArsR family regulator